MQRDFPVRADDLSGECEVWDDSLYTQKGECCEKENLLDA